MFIPYSWHASFSLFMIFCRPTSVSTRRLLHLYSVCSIYLLFILISSVQSFSVVLNMFSEYTLKSATPHISDRSSANFFILLCIVININCVAVCCSYYPSWCSVEFQNRSNVEMFLTFLEKTETGLVCSQTNSKPKLFDYFDVFVSEWFQTFITWLIKLMNQ